MVMTPTIRAILMKLDNSTSTESLAEENRIKYSNQACGPEPFVKGSPRYAGPGVRVDTWTQVERSRLIAIPSRPKKDWGIATAANSLSHQSKEGAKALGAKPRSMEASFKAFRRVASFPAARRPARQKNFPRPLFSGKTRDGTKAEASVRS